MRRRVFLFLNLTIGWLLFGTIGGVEGASAEEPAASITVRARAVTETERVAPTSFSDTIDTRRYADETQSVAEALGDSIGVSVRRFGGLGAFSTVSIRGSSANQVQIYIDGIPVSRAQNEAVNLADMPIDALERMEVYRGTTPARFGVAGIGGIVNLVTKPPSATAHTSASASYGSFQTRKFVAMHSRRIGRFDLLGFLSYLGSKGDFPYRSDRQTADNRHDDFDTTRKNNSFDSFDALLKAGTDVNPNLRLELSTETYWKENGLPGLGANPSLLASAGDLRSLNYLRLRSTDWLAEGLEGDATLYGSFERTRLSDPSPHGDLGGGPQDRHDQFTTVGMHVAPTKYFGSAQSINAFAEVAYEQYDPNNRRGIYPEPDGRRLRGTLALQYQAGLWSNLVLLVPTLRYEHLSDATSGAIRAFGQNLPALDRQRDLFSPAMGLQVQPVSWLSLRANAGFYQRAPNFTELFGNSGSVIGDPSLDSENAFNRDVGFVLDTPDLLPCLQDVHLEYAYFDNEIDDLIVFVPRSAAVFRPQNIGKARIRGHEVGVRLAHGKRLRIDANYTYQSAENRGSIYGGIYRGKQIPGRPKNELYLRPSCNVGPASLYYELNFTGGNYIDESHMRGEIPSRAIHTLGVWWSVGEPLNVGFQARNITDNRISDVAGFPLPGRSYFGTVQLNF